MDGQIGRADLLGAVFIGKFDPGITVTGAGQQIVAALRYPQALEIFQQLFAFAFFKIQKMQLVGTGAFPAVKEGTTGDVN